jgi:hypothetical protein
MAMAPKNPGKANRKNSPAVAARLKAEELAESVAAQRRSLKELRELRAQEQAIFEDDTQAPEPQAVPGAEKIADIISKLQGEGTFEVFQLANGAQSKLGTYDLVAWPEAQEALVRQHGGGEYLTVFRNADGAYAGRVTRTYDPRSYKGTPAAQTAGMDTAAFLKILQDTNAEHARQMESMRVEMARLQAEQTKLVLEMVKAQSVSPFKNVQEIAMLGKLFKDEGDDLDRLLKLRDFMEDLRGEDAPAAVHTDNPLVALITQITGALARAPQTRPATVPPPAAPAALPNPAPQPAAPARAEIAPPIPAPEPAPAADPLDMAQYVPQFTAAIKAGRSPVEAAKDVWETAEKGGYTQGVELLADQGNWEILDADPFLKEHKKWLDEFRDKLKSYSHVTDQ